MGLKSTIYDHLQNEATNKTAPPLLIIDIGATPGNTDTSFLYGHADKQVHSQCICSRLAFHQYHQRFGLLMANAEHYVTGGVYYDTSLACHYKLLRPAFRSIREVDISRDVNL